ncbi:MAG: protein kinase domain-containing protein [Spirulinaceae cyanobacterium]
MSYCLNPRCAHPDDPANQDQVQCHFCGSALLVGDRYRVMRLLSDSSGFAQIFEVQDQDIPKILKVLKPHHNSNRKVVDLFKREAVVLQDLDHPGIPKVDDRGYFPYFAKDATEPLHCFVMEKIDGPNLWQWMHQQGRLLVSQSQALDWLEQLAEILHLVHQKNYFHRDIKLQNIMMRANGQLVLIDFGTAREMTYTYLMKTGQSGNVTKVSSAGYTPPEQQQGHAVPQSDFFALGRTFVYLLTGKRLDDADIYDPLTNEFRWRQYAPDVSSAFADFLDTLMAYRAADRPPHTRALLAQIAQLKAQFSGTEITQIDPDVDPNTDYPERLPVTAMQLAPDMPTIPQPETPQLWRSPWFLGSVVVVLLGLGSYGGWWVLQGGLPPLPLASQPTDPTHESADPAPAQILVGHASFINDLVISPDSRRLISASADKTIRIWALPTGELQQTLEGHTSFVNALLISPDGSSLLSASADKTIKVWDLNTGKLQRTLKGHTNFVDELMLSPDGTVLVSSSADKTIRVWDWQTGTLTHTLEGHTGFINVLAIAPDGETLVSGSADQTLKIWNLSSGLEQQTLAGHTSFVNSLVISPDGQWLASGSADKTIRIWQLATGEIQHTLSAHTNFVNDLAISPDGQWLVSGSADKTIRIWQLATGEIEHTLTQHQGYVNRVQISQDGQTLLSGSADQTIRLWDLETGRERQVLEGYEYHVNDFAISPDDRFVAVGSGNKQITLWPVHL